MGVVLLRLKMQFFDFREFGLFRKGTRMSLILMRLELPGKYHVVESA